MAQAVCSVVWMAFAGCALSAVAKLPASAPKSRSDAPSPAEVVGAGVWSEDARALLERPDFVRTESGTTSICHRAVGFCGHVHLYTNTWSFEAVGPRKLESGRAMLETALAKYPLALLERHLEGVYLLRPGSLKQFRGGQWNPAAAGTYGVKSVYVVLETRPAREDGSRFSEAVFHHELSSILVGWHPDKFDPDAWRAANPPHFKYIDRLAGSPALATNYFADGFVCSYGKVSLENDVNTYAMHLFTRADWLLRQASQYPRVRQKLDVLMDFYGRLDPGFTREFFFRHCRTSLSAEERKQLESCSQAIAADASNAKFYGARACLYNNLELYPEAIQDAEAALQIDPQFAYGYYVRGWARVRLDMPAEAVEDFTRSIAYAPARIPAYEERARAYRMLGKTDEAQRDRETAQALKAAPAPTPRSLEESDR